MCLAQYLADCEFQCLHCDHNLLEYLLLFKFMSGLYSVALRVKVFCMCISLSDVDSLCEHCTAFEVAQREAN